MVVKKEDMDIEQSLRSAMKEYEAEAKEERAAEKAAKVKAKEPEPEPESESVEVDAAEPDGDDEPEEDTPAEDAKPAEDTAPDSEPEDEWEPPRSLSEEEKAEFKALPKELKPVADRFIRRRDLALQRYVTRVQQQAQTQVQQALEPYNEVFAALQPHMHRLEIDGSGKSLASVLKAQLWWDQQISEQPLEALAQLCARTRVTPRELYDYMSEGDGADGVPQGSRQISQGSPDPVVQELRESNRILQQRLDSIENGHVTAQWKSVVDSIAFARDDKGAPLYPYFEDLRPEIAQWCRLIGEQNPNLSDPRELFRMAYEKACWSNDNVRAILLHDRNAQRAAAALGKKRAASSLPASASNGIAVKPGQTPLSDENETIEDSLRNAAAQLGIEL